MRLKTLLLALILILHGSPDAQALRDSVQRAAPDSLRSLTIPGHSLYHAGGVMVVSGAALLPLAAVALIPVVYDGAFGITAADPGFAGAFAAAGMGLIHIGIPLMGAGADQEEREIARRDPTRSGPGNSDWLVYRRSWKHIGWGAGSVGAAVPFAVVAALDWEHERPYLGYTAIGFLAVGGALIATGLGEQYWCGYRFHRRHSNTHATLAGITGLSLRPWVLPARGPRAQAGLALVAGF